jgi:hypothetical protein
VFFKEWHTQIVVNLPATDVKSCASSNAKIFGLESLQLPNVAASGIPPEGTRIDHHWTDEPPIQQKSIYDGETTSPVQERAKYTQSLGGFLSDLDDTSQRSDVMTTDFLWLCALHPFLAIPEGSRCLCLRFMLNITGTSVCPFRESSGCFAECCSVLGGSQLAARGSA